MPLRINLFPVDPSLLRDAQAFHDSIGFVLVGDGVFVEDVALAFHSRVAVLFEGLLEFLPEIVFCVLMVGMIGEVGDAVGGGDDVVEFFGGAFAHAELPVGFIAGFFFLDDAGFGRGVVDVAVEDFGVAGRPAVGFKVAKVEVLMVADAANGVAFDVGAADVVAFFARDEGGAGFVDEARCFGVEDGHEAYS